MLTAKAWYFFYFAALACVFPFVPLLLRRRGLNEQQIGLLAALRPWLSLPAGALFSGLADRTRRHRAVLLVTYVGSVLARMALATGRSFGALATLLLITELFAAPVTIIIDSAVLAACSEEGEEGAYGRVRLWGAVGWGLMSAVSGTAITRLGITAAFACHAVLAAAALAPTALLPLRALNVKLEGLAHRGSDSAEGGSDSSSAAATAAGQRHGIPNSSNGDASTAAVEDGSLIPHRKGVPRFDSASEASPLLGADGRSQVKGMPPGRDAWDVQHARAREPRRDTAADDASSLLPPASVVDGDNGEKRAHGTKAAGTSIARRQPHVWHGLCALLSTPAAVLFFCMAILYGFGVGNIEGFLFLYLDELGGSAVLMGLCLTVTCAAETVVFYYTSALLRTLGVDRCLHLVFAGFVLRLACYTCLSLLPSPWLVLPAGTAHCGRLAPPGLESTCQSIFQGCVFGLGYGVGGLIGGFVYQRLGARAVYLVACAVMVAGWSTCTALQVVLEARRKGREYQAANSLELADVHE